MSLVALYQSLTSSENLLWPLATCPAATMIVLCSLHVYEKMQDLLSVWCSFGLQSFNIFEKRTGSHSVQVPAITVSNHYAPTLASREVSSTRESDTTTESPIDHLCNKRGQVQCKITWWVSCLYSTFLSWTEWAEICSLKPVNLKKSKFRYLL